MDIISKDKKDIQWKGFPPMVGDGGERTGGAASGRDKEKARLKAKIDQKSKELRQKEGHLKELVNQFVSLKQLLGRNQHPEYSDESDKQHRIYLPFVIGETPTPSLSACFFRSLKCAYTSAVCVRVRVRSSIWAAVGLVERMFVVWLEIEPSMRVGGVR